MKKKLLTILLSIFMSLGCFVNVVHAEKLTVNDVLKFNNNIPTMTGSEIPVGAWTNNNGGYLFIYEDRIHFTNEDGYPYAIDKDESVIDKKDGTYTYNNNKVTFTISNDTLVNVIVSGVPSFFDEQLIGTYTAPVTIADILDTVDGGYPVAPDDQTVPDGCFTTVDGYRLFYIPDKTELVISDTPFFSIDPTQAVTLDANGNYITTVTGDIDINVKFVMNNNKLQRIEAEAPAVEMNYVFEPIGNRKMLVELFDTLDSKPESLETSWVNENSNHIYVYNEEYLVFHEADLGLPVFSYLKPSGNSYSETLNIDGVLPSKVTVNMENGILKNINVTFTDAALDVFANKYNIPEPDKEIIKKSRGTYTAPVTVADVLAMSEEQFPTNPLKGWVNAAGSKATSGFGNLRIGENCTIPFTTTLSGNSNDNYTYTNGSVTVTFVIESNKLVKINVTGSDTDTNGDYEPYKYTEIPTFITVGSTSDVEFVTNAKFIDQASTPVTVAVDDNPLTYGTHYEVTSGSTHVKLKGSYISTLAVGSHTIKISMTGYSDLTSPFTITGSSPTPTPSPSPSSDTTSGYKIPKTGVE